MNDLKIFMSDKLSSSNNRAEIYKKVRTTYIACTVCVEFLVIAILIAINSRRDLF